MMAVYLYYFWLLCHFSYLISYNFSVNSFKQNIKWIMIKNINSWEFFLGMFPYQLDWIKKCMGQRCKPLKAFAKMRSGGPRTNGGFILKNDITGWWWAVGRGSYLDKVCHWVLCPGSSCILIDSFLPSDADRSLLHIPTIMASCSSHYAPRT